MQRTQSSLGFCSCGKLRGQAWRQGVPTRAGERLLVVFFRLCLGWTFLWAGIHHFGDDKFVPGFLGHTKTFHAYYAPLASPDGSDC